MKQRVYDSQKQFKKQNIESIISFVNKYNGIKYANDVAMDYSQKAKDLLKQFEESDSRLALELLVDFVIERKN